MPEEEDRMAEAAELVTTTVSLHRALTDAARDTDFIVGISAKNVLLIAHTGDVVAGRTVMIHIMPGTRAEGPDGTTASTTEFFYADDPESLQLYEMIVSELMPRVREGSFIPIPDDASGLGGFNNE